MAPVFVVRHGQTDWNAGMRLQGQAETDLNATGRLQAAANGRLLAGLIGDPERFRFIASPMRRTRETMEIIRAELGLPRDGYALEPRIVEIHFGEWQGLTYDDLERMEPGVTARRDADKWDFLPPGAGAETYRGLAERIEPWLASLEGPALVVTHGGVVRAMFHLLNRMPGAEAAAMSVCQDRVLRMENGRIGWVAGPGPAATGPDRAVSPE